MEWPWHKRKASDGESLLPLAAKVPSINGLAMEPIETERSQQRPGHVRTTSAQSRSVADEFSFMTTAEAASRLQTSLTHGLSAAEALNRLRDWGLNEIPHEPPEPLWLRFVKQFQEPLIVLLLVSAGASIFLGNMDDAVSITVAVTIVVTVGFVQEYRSEKSIEALSHLVPNHAHLVRSATSKAPAPMDGDESVASTTPGEEMLEATSSKVMASQLVPGDLVYFTTGDRIPADIRVTKAADLTIDESNLTGENEPVRITTEPRARSMLSPAYGADTLQLPSPSALSDNRDIGGNGDNNIAWMGTLVRSGHGQGIVFATGGNTHFGTIATSVSGTESPRSPLQLSMDDLGSQLSKVSFVIIGLISLVGWLQGKKLLEIFTISISLAVAAIPEGLPIIVTVTLALGVHRMARHNAIVRKMPKVETLGSVNVVCTDKTGTLTMNHMTTAKMWYFGANDAIDVDSDDEATETKPDPATLRILRIGNIANNGRLAQQYTENGAAARAVLSSTQGTDFASTFTRWCGQPTDVAMLDLLDRFKEHDVRESIGPRLSETPFSSERKWMGVTIGTDSKEFAYMKGAIDRVLDACDTYLTRDGREIVLDSSRRDEALQAAEAMAAKGLRVLAFASGVVSRSSKGRATLAPTTRSSTPGSPRFQHDETYKGLTFAGLVGMSDPPRPGVGRSIRRLLRGGVKVVMITGDAETTAVAIGRQLGMPIAQPTEYASSQASVRPVLRGEDIDAMSEKELAQAIEHTTIFARTNPDHKLKIIRAFQSRGDIVAMTGDGVNDAPALKRADIGISMGLHGTDVAKEAADMILTDDDFSTILRAIEEGKGIFNNIQNFLTFQLSTSAAGLSLVFFCTLLGFKSPLNAMQILWINIIMDGPPAQSLGVEAVDADVMNRPPRKRNDAVLTKDVLLRVLTSASIIMAGTMLVYSREMLADGEVNRRDTTMTFTCFVLFDMFNALACRSESKSVLRGEVGLFSNTLFNWAVSLSIAGQLLVIYFPWLQEVFQTEALGFFDLLGLLMLCSTVFWADEFRKYWKYARRRLAGGYSQAVLDPTPTARITPTLPLLASSGSYAPLSQLAPMSNLMNGVSPHRADNDNAADGALVSPTAARPGSSSNTTSIYAASSIAEVRAALDALHTRESTITSRLDALLGSQADLARELGRLDLLRAGLGGQVIAARSVGNDMLATAADTAGRLSNKVKELDLEKSRVEDTLEVVKQVVELKACVQGVVGSMGAPQDWEAAAAYLARAAQVPEDITKGKFASSIVPSVEVPDTPWVTLENAKESLCGLFLREFEKATKEGDGAKVTRFFKLFPLIGRGEVGLDVYGRYVCQGVAGTARSVLKEGPGVQARKEGFFYANALTRLFDHIARIVDGHGGLVERHYGSGKMVRVIERLQQEADVQGGIILDSWSDERDVDRRLKDVKSYPFSFLVQSFLPPQRSGTPRVNSPAMGAGANQRLSEDEGVNMKEVDGILSEIAVMLGRWSLYSRFLAGKTRDPSAPEDAPLAIPEVVIKSNLKRKISDKLTSPYNTMMTFFFRRSVEKAFQLDEFPTGLSLSMSRQIDTNQPFIISAVDDVMYVVSAVIQKSTSTSQRDVIASVIPTIGRVLGSDFVGMIQRKMRDESYPKPIVQGGFPPEDKIIQFIILINSLDTANEYLGRIINSNVGSANDSRKTNGDIHESSLRDTFPFDKDFTFVTSALNTLHSSFTTKTTELMNEGLQVLFKQVIQPRLRPVLSDTFRDVDYSLTEEELVEFAEQNEEDEEELLDQVSRRFEHGWDQLMKPIARLMTTHTFTILHDLTARYLARVLERRVWDARANAYGVIRMERDFSSIISTVSKGNYGVRELFARVSQILMVANMEEEEWEEISAVAGSPDEDEDGMIWVLTEDERRRARQLTTRERRV
ncbi:calcium-transporting P-type ATPase [Colletotrichum truncatum]|uniref:Calcium-transporting P-type ATPase n=1 Tax=Colletotrichum truncatum TaxID=5467 RepID=A0ACC3Z4Q9_COLTU|nr:calcium-transporting P-type ATPase [Colletotrichum truncatum]KAF6788634.1 calcium-transporting P-type ATPase [Colletotrichum truncatum]